MRVKTFRGESMAAVLSQVRQELGSEAVILGNQTVREEGKCLCEVMAALEQPNPAPTRKASGNGKARAGVPAESQAGPATSATPASGGDWNREWGEIKGHLLALLRPRMDFGTLSPRQRLALEFLEREGVDEASVLALYRSIVERGEDTVIPALSRLLRVKPLTTRDWPETAHMFIGPSGVGKTTNLLRLALTARRQEPARRVVVVNADGGRGKGRLLLRHYAELSGLAYAEADGPEDFRRIFDEAAGGDAVFVDTPSVRGDGAMEGWCREMGISGRKGLCAHLALSPLYAAPQAAQFLRVYRCEPLASLVWTKLDEACNYGSLVNMAHASSLPVSALAYGPELTQGMTPASGKAVWKLLFKHQLPGDYPDAEAGV
ncbi:GTP-binding signal recognition particle SRP54 G- domain protein [Solidesulfovibrio carbinoliphilus subsp. oakridgensis]|uniref:GTP-binding signal recognition particle SRP54 G-domain protein n=1 Tax=Solidesulfovibrio carbinoliphilus subsp. oakridgensis TaxID=694327 RepID=G7Q461_9BACT|nr:flagellar biosynthesis protein FlhF [Solidesulfovibrio carbinoliphilus]EHJ46851.1 GTP-binding signal recognition particle SRP54 G- domain protein [Solidesulfovibrio carbinoliphilus subsp. oakridgensis]